MLSLPDNRIKSRWIKVSKDPATNKIGKYSVIVDRAYHHERFGGGIAEIHVAYVKDHPFLDALNSMAHVPRAVKSIYRGSVRLKHLRLRDAWEYFKDMEAAEAAWGRYAGGSA